MEPLSIRDRQTRYGIFMRGSEWTGVAYTETRPVVPFAILDTVYDGIQFLLAVDSALDSPPLTVHWSPDNHSA